METAAAPTTMAEVKRFAQLAVEKGSLKDRLTAIEAEMGILEPTVLEWFASNGVDRVKVDGQTLHLKMELWAGRANGVTNEQAIEALRAAGLDEMAAPRINTQTLSAYCRELIRNGEPLPASFGGIIVVHETAKVGTRRS